MRTINLKTRNSKQKYFEQELPNASLFENACPNLKLIPKNAQVGDLFAKRWKSRNVTCPLIYILKVFYQPLDR